MSKQEPVAWRVHPFDYGFGHEGAYAISTRPEQRDSWIRKDWKVDALYIQPTSEVVKGLADALESLLPMVRIMDLEFYQKEYLKKAQDALEAYKEENK